ncbi:MAG: hypothetical protein OXG04_09020 [Acidobacteria bacterium]|nr:hypothetical protein [Acidobacteriota bacterium]
MWELLMGWTGIGTLAAIVAAAALFAGARTSETRSAGRHEATKKQVAALEAVVDTVKVDVGTVKADVGTLSEQVAEGFGALKEQIDSLQSSPAAPPGNEAESGHRGVTAGGRRIILPEEFQQIGDAWGGTEAQLPALARTGASHGNRVTTAANVTTRHTLHETPPRAASRQRTGSKVSRRSTR